MSGATRFRAAALAALLPLLVGSAGRARATSASASDSEAVLQAPAAQAQGGALHGRVLDPAGKPVAGQDVALHRVTQAGGAMVATARTDPEGRFELAVPATAPADSAVFFVAARYEGQLYIGQPFRPPVPAATEYDVTVGVGAVSPGPLGSTGTGLAQAQAAQSTRTGGVPRWLPELLLGLIVAGALGWALLEWLRRRRRLSNRELLVRIAELDEAHGAAGSDAATAAEYRARRDALVARFEAMAGR